MFSRRSPFRRRTLVLTGVALTAIALTACKPEAGTPTPTPTTTSSTTTSSTTTTEPTTTTTTPTSTTTTTTTAKPPTSQPAPGALPPGVVPEPGQVGFRGDINSLRVITGPGNLPAGTVWNTGALQVIGDNVTLDGLNIKASVDYYGKGTLTIRNSVIEGNHFSYAAVMGRSGHLDIRDTTITYKKGDTTPGWPWGNGALHGDSTMTVVRTDISGYPDGVDVGPGDSQFEQNYIHDLARLGEYPDNVHNDGIQNYGGKDLVIKYNRIDISGPNGLAYDGQHQNGAVFIQPDNQTPSVNPQIIGNYLRGGGFTLRLEEPMRGAVVTDNKFGPTTGGWGESTREKDVTIATWSNNTNAAGKQIGPPTS